MTGVTSAVSYADVVPGTELPAVAYPVTRLSLVKYCGASGDFNVIHWNERVARSVGLPDVIAHGMFTTAQAGRYVTDWAGPEAMVRKIAIRLGVPCYAGDKLTFSGRGEWRGQECVVEVTGRCSLGDHVTGTVHLGKAP